MKTKILNAVITLSAVIGVILVIGACGTMDYMVEIHQNYPLLSTFKLLCIGFVMTLPALFRGCF